MIGWLQGNVREIDPAGLVVLETQGVGYEVSVSMQTLCSLKVGETAPLHIHTHVREDQITLFGFASTRERALFRKLNTVSGIGARTALNMLSGMPLEELLQAIEQGNDAAIARTPGIGKKTAQRVILELKGKLAIESEGGTPAASPVGEDVRSALTNLGYKPAQIDKAVKNIDAAADFESAFKAALKAIS